MAAMKNKKTSRNKHAAIVEPTARHLWLASLGALVAVRRESKAAVKRASSKLENTVADARYALRRAEADVRASVHGVRTQVEPKMHKFSSDVEARLAPVLAKLGLDTKAKRAPRKARKTTAKAPRRTVRKPARRVAKQAAN